jgi:uncharacterized membrane protein
MKRERWITLDILKAIFLVLMLFGHTLVWWFFEEDTFLPHPSRIVDFFVTPYIQINTYLMFMFPMIAGCALRMQIEHRQFLALVKRGLFVFLLGFIINYKSWDVLQLIGTGIILISIIEKSAKKYSATLLMGLLIFILASANYFNQSLSAYDHTYWKPVLFGNKTGKFYFPVFPFLGVILFGYVFQSLQIWATNSKQVSQFWFTCFVAGSFAILLSFASGTLTIHVDLKNIWGPEIFCPPLTRLIANIGLFLVVVPIVDYFVKSSGITKLSSTGWIQIFSRNILYIYTAHYLFAEWFMDRLESLDHLIFLAVGFGIQMILAYILGRWIEHLSKTGHFKTRWSWL